MKVYTYPKSRSLRVLWVLEELGLAYSHERVDLMSATPKIVSPHPQHKVPVLDDNGFIIFESAAICKYLWKKYSHHPLSPENIYTHAIVDQWLSFALTELEPPLWYLLKHQFLLPAEKQVSAVVKVAREDALKAIDCLQHLNLKNWLAGDDFTIADVFLAHNLQWAKFCGLTLGAKLEGYLIRAQQRPAYDIAVEKNNG